MFDYVNWGFFYGLTEKVFQQKCFIDSGIAYTGAKRLCLPLLQAACDLIAKAYSVVTVWTKYTLY